jgi:hypothetical protein
MTNTQNKRHARAMYKAALQYIKTYTDGEADVSYVKGIYKDAADLHIIGDLISTGDVNKASAAAWKLDTIVREFIPEPVWNEYF